VAILPVRDHNSIPPVGFEALLGCKGATVSYNFPTAQGTLVNLELLKEAT